MLFRQPLICLLILFVHNILFQKTKLNKEENITGLYEVTAVEGYLMEIYATMETIGFSLAYTCWMRRSLAVNRWVVTDLRPMLNQLLIILYQWCICCSPSMNSFLWLLFASLLLTIITFKDRGFPKLFLLCLLVCTKFMILFKLVYYLALILCFKTHFLCRRHTLYGAKTFLYTINLGGQNTVKNGQKTVKNRRK